MKRRGYLIYIAAPYSAESPELVQKNIEYAREMEIDLLKRGFSVICPHMNTANLDDILPWRAFLDISFTILSRVDAALFCGYWQQSRGCLMEWEYCERNNIPRFTRAIDLENYFEAKDGKAKTWL